MRSVRRWLFLAHRWMGIALCLFMAMWFVSGVVMMYVGYPKLTPLERLKHLPDLTLAGDCCVPPQRALELAHSKSGNNPNTSKRRQPASELPEIRLAMVGDTPSWLISGSLLPIAVDARTGELTVTVDAARARIAAEKFAAGFGVRFLETLRQDIFTVSRALDPHRPLHHFALDDDAGTEVYVSSRTGEIVRDSTRFERGWNYFGAVLHWLYPLKGEFFDPWRPDIIIYLSLAGTVLAMLGIWIGVVRWRFGHRYNNGQRTPYRDGWMRWHHVSGLFFGLVTLTWIFSGLLSMNPWKVFESSAPRPDVKALTGLALANAPLAITPAEAIAKAGFSVREVTLQLFNGRPYYILFSATGHSVILAADSPSNEPIDMFPEQELRMVAQRLLPGHVATKITLLRQYDNYYYSRREHTMTGHIDRRLPVLRVEYDDPHRTWIHLDLYTGRIHSRIDDTGRTRRWLFAFLHSFDAQGLIDRRPLWDAVLILLSIGGCVVCVSGSVIGWRRLRAKTGRSTRKQERAQVRPAEAVSANVSNV